MIKKLSFILIVLVLSNISVAQVEVTDDQKNVDSQENTTSLLEEITPDITSNVYSDSERKYLYTRLWENYDVETVEWYPTSRNTYRYNEDGFLVSRVWQLTENGDWKNAHRWEFTPDNNGYTSYTTAYDWNDRTTQWVVSSASESERDASGRLLKFIKYDNQQDELIPISRSAWEFDEFGHETLEERYQWNRTAQVWIGESKWSKKFKGSQKPLESTYYDWDEENLNWIGDSRYEWGYDPDFDEVNQRKDFTWDNENETWSQDEAHRYFYNSFGEIAIDTFFRISKPDYTHIPYLYGIREFDEDGNRLSSRRFTKNSSNVFAEYFRRDFTLDEHGNTISDSTKNFDHESNVLTGQSVFAYEFDNLNRQTMYARYLWYEPRDEWSGSYKTETGYDSFGNRSLHVAYNWNHETSDWIYTIREECLFNDQGQPTEYSEYKWNRELSEWHGEQKQEFNYDSDGVLVSQIFYSWETEQSDWTLHRRLVLKYLPLKSSQQIEYSQSSITYGDTIAIEASSNSGLPLEFESMNPEILAISDDNIIGLKSGEADIIITQEGNDHYETAELVATVNIDKAQLTIMANDQTIKHGDPLPELTLSYDGFIYEDNETSLVPPLATTTATSSTISGIFEIILSGGEAENYILHLVNGTLTIENPLSLNETTQKIYPNPVEDVLFINYSDVKSIYIYDLSGRLVEYFTPNTDNTYDVSSLESSTFILVVERLNDRFIQKIQIK